MKEIETYLKELGWTSEIEREIEYFISPQFPLGLDLEYSVGELSLTNAHFGGDSIIIKLNPSIEDIEKFVELLSYKPGSFISSFDIKTKLQIIFDKLNLDKVATATQIEEYYKVKSTDKKIEGNQTRGYEILYPLYK